MRLSLISILSLCFAWLAAPAWGSADARYALVIGNASYDSAPLANPLNDASDMAEKLEQRGFQVTKLLDANKRQMEDAIYQFTRRLGGEGSVGLFYFAGHGLEIDGENYLVPVNAQIRDETDGRYNTVHAGKLLDRMNAVNNGVNLVILDACRNNPFKRGWRSMGAGLAQMRPAKGTLILYATEPRKQAADGAGRNGVFTERLLKIMDEPGVPVEMAFKRVSAQVEDRTGGEQVPWFEGVIHGQFYFLAPTQVQVQSPTPNPVTPAVDYDLRAWESAERCDRSACYQAYLDQYPEGRFAAMARALLSASQSQSTDIPPALTSADDERRLGLQRDERRMIQQALNALGHPVGLADGIWGANTRDGIRAWQRTAGLEASGYLNGQSYTQLVAEAAPRLEAERARQAQAQAETKRKAHEEERARQAQIQSERKAQEEERKRQAQAQAEAKRKAREAERARQAQAERKAQEAEQKRQAKAEEDRKRHTLEQATRRSYEPEMLLLSGGSFRMGDLSDSGYGTTAKPVHEVRLRGFKLAKYEVTKGQFAAFVQASGYRTDAEKNRGDKAGCYIFTAFRLFGDDFRWESGTSWRDPGFRQSDNDPVVCITWNDAQAYIDWLNRDTGKSYRLPTEAEWEYAARAGSTSIYSFGDSESELCRHGNLGDQMAKKRVSSWPPWIAPCDDGHLFPAPVGSYRSNGFGLYDMIGNVSEWVQDCWNEGYSGAPTDGSAWESGNCGRRVLRGGNWVSGPSQLRSADRSSGDRNGPYCKQGFRLAQD